MGGRQKSQTSQWAFFKGRFPPWRVARTQPISVNGAFPLPDGPFSDLNGPFPRMP